MNRRTIYLIVGVLIFLAIVFTAYYYLTQIPQIKPVNTILNLVKPNEIVINNNQIIFSAPGSINKIENNTIKPIVAFPLLTETSLSLNGSYYFSSQNNLLSIYKLGDSKPISTIDTIYFQWIDNEKYFFSDTKVAAQGTDDFSNQDTAQIIDLKNKSNVKIPTKNTYTQFFNYQSNELLFAQFTGVEQQSPIIKQNTSTNSSQTLFDAFSINQIPKSNRYIFQIQKSSTASPGYYNLVNNELKELNSNVDWLLADFVTNNEVISISYEKDTPILVLTNIDSNAQKKIAKLNIESEKYSKLLYSNNSIYLIAGSNIYQYDVSEFLK